jgi:two-component system, chemotaxis family, chemotaxis protein CheY
MVNEAQPSRSSDPQPHAFHRPAAWAGGAWFVSALTGYSKATVSVSADRDEPGDAWAAGPVQNEWVENARRARARRVRRNGAWKMAADRAMPVLVVDDYNTMIRIIRNLLKQIGFSDIDDAADGSAALARMREKKYGLVISDWNMEPMTGYELLKEVRADPGLSKTPFIMVTAESKTENVIAAKKAGVNNYIVKPFNAQTLQSKIEAVFPD